MADLNIAKQIADDLEGSKAYRDAGKTATAVGAVLLSAIPVVGDAVKAAAEKVADRLFDPGLEEKFTQLCRIVAALRPDLDKIEDLEQRLGDVADAIARNDELQQRAVELATALQPAVRRDFKVLTDNGEQSFSNVMIKNMRTLAEAYNGGTNNFDNFHTKGGPAEFIAKDGGVNRVANATFEGDPKPGYVSELVVEGLDLTGHQEVRYDPSGFGGFSIGFRAPGAISAPVFPRRKP